MTSLASHVRIERDGSVTTITLDRPESLNAFDHALAVQLMAALRTAASDDTTRAIILTGYGRGFSAGQDVRELARETASGGPAAVHTQMTERYNPMIVFLRELELPVICAINGVTTGVGLGLALACDIRIASADAMIGISPLSIAFIPGVGSSILLPALIGLARATELAFLGERIDATKAYEIGLVHRVVPPDQLLDEARTLAERLATLPTKTIGITKRAFNAAMLPNLRDHLANEAIWQQEAASTEDHREGLAALLEKRTPRFTGR